MVPPSSQSNLRKCNLHRRCKRVRHGVAPSGRREACLAIQGIGPLTSPLTHASWEPGADTSTQPHRLAIFASVEAC